MDEWRLIAPSIRYRPAPLPDDPVEAEARRRLERDRAAGTGPQDWPPEEMRKSWRIQQAYYRAASSQPVVAPPSWPAELALIAVATVIAAFGARAGHPLAFVLAMGPLESALDGMRTVAKQRSARRLGVTPETMPQPVLDAGCVVHLAATLGWPLWRRVRGEPYATPVSWPLYLATRLISALNERRSWRRAFTTATGRPVASDSTAAADTAHAA